MADIEERSVNKPVDSFSPRILVLLPFSPRLDATHGGSRAIAQLLLTLAKRHQLALLYLRAREEPPIDDMLRALCHVVEEIERPLPRNAGLGRWIDRLRLLAAMLYGTPLWVSEWDVDEFKRLATTLVESWQPDIIQINYHLMAQYLPAFAGSAARRLLVEYEPGTSAAMQHGPGLHPWAKVKHHLDVRAWKMFEQAVAGQVDAVVALTERDRSDLRKLAGDTPVVVIPLATNVPAHALSPLGNPPLSLLFVGNFTHRPNVDAATRLITRIFPALRQSHPTAELLIVGDQPPAGLRALAHEGVRITGRVPDITPFLDRASLVVVPLRLGGGMRVKVLEALAAGKAVIATSLAVEGLDVVHGAQILLADTDEEFVAASRLLLDNPLARGALARRARMWADANLSWEKHAMAYEQLYASLLSPPRSGYQNNSSISDKLAPVLEKPEL